MRRFKNRVEAGQLLGARLLPFKDQSPLVLAIPRGGVPVAFEVAKEIKAPMDLAMVKKIGAPRNPELAVGAVSEDATPYLNEDLIERLHLDRKALQLITKQKIQDLHDQLHKFRGNRPPHPIENHVIIVVDDGIATGATLLAAIAFLRKKKPAKIIVATPVASKDSIHELQTVADDVICLETPDEFKAVGLWYDHFDQVSDEEVIHLLKEISYLKAHGLTDEVKIEDNQVELRGHLTVVPQMKALVLFAHGSGSSRLSPRNQFLSRELNKAGFGTLLLDLLTDAEAKSRNNIFDVTLLAKRILRATDWLKKRLGPIPLAYFGANSGSAAAFIAASQNPANLFTVISRGGRPDLAGNYLAKVRQPSLLIVGTRDEFALKLNEQAQKKIPHCQLDLILGADHHFQEPGALDEVVEHSLSWLLGHLPKSEITEKTITETKRGPRVGKGKSLSP